MIRFVRAKLMLLEVLDEIVRGIVNLPKGSIWNCISHKIRIFPTMVIRPLYMLKNGLSFNSTTFLKRRSSWPKRA